MFLRRIMLPAILLLAGVLGGCELPPGALAPGPTTPGAVPPSAQTVPANLPSAVPLWTATPAAGQPSASSQDAIAVVNGVPIRRQHFDQQLSQARMYYLMQPGVDAKTEAGQQGLQRLDEQVLDWLIDEALITQEASKRGLAVSAAQIDAEVARMRGNDGAAFSRWLQSNGLTVEALREQVRYDLVSMALRDAVTRDLPRSAAQVHARHILVSSEQAAKDALRRLQRGEDLVQLAQQLSEDEATRDLGGDLGFLPRGAMPPAFEEVAFALKPGQTSGIVPSEFGFHIIQVLAVDANRAIPDDLWPMVQQRAFDAWLAQLRAQAKIERR